MLFNTCSKYLSTHKPLAIAVWIIENNNPDANAPFSVLENKKFFLDITNGFTALSARLFDISKYPYSLYVAFINLNNFDSIPIKIVLI